MNSRILYQVGVLARNAFMAGRGIPDLGRISDEDNKAFCEYSESEQFDVLCQRIEREIDKGSSND